MRLDSPAVALSVHRRNPRRVVASLAQGPPVLLDFAAGAMRSLPLVPTGAMQWHACMHPALHVHYECTTRCDTVLTSGQHAGILACLHLALHAPARQRNRCVILPALSHVETEQNGLCLSSSAAQKALGASRR